MIGRERPEGEKYNKPPEAFIEGNLGACFITIGASQKLWIQ